MKSNPIGGGTPNIDASLQLNLLRVSNQNQPEPLLTVLDTARAEVNAAAFMTSYFQPPSDGIYTIGSVAAKVTSAIQSAASAHWSTWGF